MRSEGLVALIAMLVAGLLMGLIALAIVGCGTAPLETSGGFVLDPFDGMDVVEYAGNTGEPRLTIGRDGQAVLSAVVYGNACPTRGDSGPVIQLARAFLGAAVPSSVGDTLGGAVVPSTVIDTFTVLGGRFWAQCVAPDTLEGFAWLRLSSGASCRQDSIVRPFRLVRISALVLNTFKARGPAPFAVAGSEFGILARAGSEALALRCAPLGRPTLTAPPARASHAGT